MQTILIIAGLTVIGIQLLFIHLQNRKIMSNQDQVLADIQLIKGALVDISAAESAEADNLTKIAQEISDLKDQVANGGDQTATVTALDDLATRATAAATAAKANAATLDGIVNPPAPVEVPPTEEPAA